MKKVLITGGAGFIGSNLAFLLSKSKPNLDIVVLDSLTYAGNLETIQPLITQKKISFVRADIRKREEIRKIFEKEGFDTVFHLAAESHVDRSINSAADFIETNVLGTEVLLESALATKVKKFLHISTDEVYGSLGETGLFYENTPLDPTSPYSASKAASDLVALSFHKTHKLPVIVTRCTNNYGPYQFPEKFIPLFITHAMNEKPLPLYGDGKNVRSWLHVDDHCHALIELAEKGAAGEVYNIGPDGSEEHTNIEVASTILKLLGKSSGLIKYVTDRPAHDRRYAVDIKKITSDIGWKPKVNFTDGIISTVNWYKENKDWWSKILSGAYREFYEINYSNR